ncbi:SatD family protein [Microbacterium sp. PA5]|uniref:SatD family protein n=1 Tax=Microbacterium sp. PA5 TaxID=3416654 RepID=UPI003CFBA376
MERRIVTIADIVGSRSLPDRSAAQRAIEDAVTRVERDAPAAEQPLVATVGDEFQAVHTELSAALRSLLLLQLALPEGIELRFGVGVGGVRAVDSRTELISDGPGWWAARDAIEAVHRLQDRGMPKARIRVVGAPEEDADMMSQIRMANAYLLARDELVGAMSSRARRLTYGRWAGRTQRELAEEEGISQPAVSQMLAAAGSAALLAGLSALEGDDR